MNPSQQPPHSYKPGAPNYPSMPPNFRPPFPPFSFPMGPGVPPPFGAHIRTNFSNGSIPSDIPFPPPMRTVSHWTPPPPPTGFPSNGPKENPRETPTTGPRNAPKGIGSLPNPKEAEEFLREALSLPFRLGVFPPLDSQPPPTRPPTTPNPSSAPPRPPPNTSSPAPHLLPKPSSVGSQISEERKSLLRQRLLSRLESEKGPSPPLPTAPTGLTPSHSSDTSSQGTQDIVPDIDEEEGFRIVSAERPLESPNSLKSLPKFPGNDVGPSSRAVFGPQVVKEALVALGSRASAVNIAEWIAQNKPFYLNYFGNLKKLRYSVSGILSARTYGHIFQKRIEFNKGVRQADWVLLDGSILPEEEQTNETHLSHPYGEDFPPLNELDYSSASTEEEKEPLEVTACQTCQRGVDDEQLLLCDNCDVGYHLYCLEPPLEEVPQGPWFCSHCLPYISKEMGPDWDKWEEGEGEGEEEEEEEEGIDSEGEGSSPVLLSPRACEKHRRWKKRCPDNCPMRSKVRGIPSKGRQRTKPWRAPRVPQEDLQEDSQGSQGNRRGGPELPTYIEMIGEAIQSLGGSASTPAITSYLNSRYGPSLVQKTKTWRNSVSGCLSTHFDRDGKDRMGRTLWSERTSGKTSRGGKSKTSQTSLHHFHPSHLQDLETKAQQAMGPLGHPPIEYLNSSHPVVHSRVLSHPGAVMDFAVSPDGRFIASGSSLGTVRIWDLGPMGAEEQILAMEKDPFVKEMRDSEEEEAEEFLVVRWSPSGKFLFAAGSKKSRRVWDSNQEPLHLPPCIKIFEVESGKVVGRLEGHSKDIFCMKFVSLNSVWFLFSASEDGTIRKWNVASDFGSSDHSVVLGDDRSDMVLHFDMVPNTGNKYLLAACDEGLKLFDVELNFLVQTFPRLYGYVCDYLQFVDCVEIAKSSTNESFVITRGIDFPDEDTPAVSPVTSHLRQLKLPPQGKGKFSIQTIHHFHHSDFYGNTWLQRLGSNGRYLLSPTSDGRVFTWNLRSCELVAILRDHQSKEVREIDFHATRPLLLTSGDDSTLRIYFQPKTSEGDSEEPTTVVTLPEIVGTQSPTSPKSENEKEEENMYIEEEPQKDVEEEEDAIDKSEASFPHLRKRDRSFPRHLQQWDTSQGEEEWAEETSSVSSKRVKKEKSPNLDLNLAASPELELMYKRRGRGLPGSCEQHKREHVKCPADCPNRLFKIPSALRSQFQ